MKKGIILTVLSLLLLGAGALWSQTLPTDLNGNAIQAGKSFLTMRYSPAADTLWDAVSVPAAAYKAVVIPATGSAGIRLDDSNANNYFVTIPANVPVTLDIGSMTQFYIRRAAAGTATVLNIIWLRL